MKKLFALTLCCFSITTIANSNQWPTFNGNLQAQKYSPLTQITPKNVTQLKPAWVVHTGDVATGKGKIPQTVWSATPLFANNTIYVGTPFYRIFAINPGTGKIKWIFDPHAKLKALTQPAMKSRGVAYWQAAHPKLGAACQKIVYVGTMDAKLFAVDANTGKPCKNFGNDGMVNINQWNPRKDLWPLSLLQPPTVYKNLIFVGWAGRDWSNAVDPPGTVFALNAQTGKRVWTFYSIPKKLANKTGTANVWASMSLDPKKGILYIPVSSPSPNFWGGNRSGKIPLATSVTALNAMTGKILWSKQLVHHDLWDYDTNSPPTLFDMQRDGKKIPALIQTSKLGFLYVLNRYTGKPLFPLVEKPVPASHAFGEKAAKTQPFAMYPEPTNFKLPGVYWLANLVSFGYCEKKRDQLNYQGPFTPPSEKGTIVYPGTVGGIEWGGGAVDPNNNIFVVNSSRIIQIQTLIPRKKYQKMILHGVPSEAGGGVFAMKGAPYALNLQTFLNPLGMPCWKPPYGELSAYNLNTGKLLWRKPFGQIQKWGFYMPKSWGSVTIGSPIITKSGLVFIGASMDSRVRAIDLNSGKVLWKYQVDAPVVASPASYRYKGKQYVIFVAGGNSILTPKVSDEIIAFALPNHKK